MNYSVKTADAISNEALRADNARLAALVGKYEANEEKRKNDEMLARVNAREEAEQDKLDEARAAKLNLERDAVPRPPNARAYSNLPYGLKTRLIEAFGSDFPLEVAAFERSGLATWEAFDKLRAEAKKK